MYGGTEAEAAAKAAAEGLSPRVRGNQRHWRAEGDYSRSIPACTGEPSGPSRTWAWATVYPRVYGGTPPHLESEDCITGLSPRVRGNHYDSPTDGVEDGSIPACTGEPPSQQCEGSPLQVYPRVYGGTGVMVIREGLLWGLSPRVRGNRFGRQAGPCFCRSIPACTGEPQSVSAAISPLAVYPRVYGGTCLLRLVKKAQIGLSPRVRGNPKYQLPSWSS